MVWPDDDTFPPGGTEWEMLHPKMTMEALGFLPGFLRASDPRPAREQIDERYVSGWRPHLSDRFTLLDDNTLIYPQDPPFPPLAQTKLRDELICFYQGSFLAIIQPDRSFEVARVD